MTPPHTEGMKELIEKLEKAGGPDRFLDAIICFRAHPHKFRGLIEHEWVRSEAAAYSPKYTSSIDVALTLVPEGYDSVSASINERGQSSMRIGTPYVFGNGATPAIALCIAALKSRAALGEKA